MNNMVPNTIKGKTRLNEIRETQKRAKEGINRRNHTAKAIGMLWPFSKNAGSDIDKKNTQRKRKKTNETNLRIFLVFSSFMCGIN